MIRATRSRSRSTNHWNGSWIERRGSKMLDFRWFPVPCRALLRSIFSRAFSERFSVLLGGFGGSKVVQKHAFCLLSWWSVARTLLDSILERFWVNFQRGQPQSDHARGKKFEKEPKRGPKIN